MVKKIIFLLLASTNLMVAQTTIIEFSEDCIASLEFQTRKVQATAEEFSAIELTWKDINSEVFFNQLIIEVQPLNDCMNGILGETLFNPLFFDLLDLKKNSEKVVKLGMHTTVNRKCFKWRIIAEGVRNSNEVCKVESEWIFTPFIY